MKKIILLSLAIALIMVSGVALAASSTQMINYQGKLFDGATAPIDGDVSVVFSIYDGETASVALWTEPQTVTFDEGLYSVKLGEVNPIPSNLFNGSERYLGIKVGADPEMTPRSQLTSVAFSFNSQRLGGKVIQSGQETLSVSGTASETVAVTFPVPFAAAPQVITGALSSQIDTETFIVDQVTAITTTGCNVSFTSLGGASATGIATFDWIAIGE